MASYRQRVQAMEQVQAMKAQQRLRDEAEDRHKMSLSASECYEAGVERGTEDAADGYTGAIERRTLGDDYAYPEEYRAGYRAAFYAET